MRIERFLQVGSPRELNPIPRKGQEISDRDWGRKQARAAMTWGHLSDEEKERIWDRWLSEDPPDVDTYLLGLSDEERREHGRLSRKALALVYTHKAATWPAPLIPISALRRWIAEHDKGFPEVSDGEIIGDVVGSRG